ncbi:hypothetical protein ABZZ37_28250 [Streptomyces sp. NPDC006464]|uniref:hypothetical protein n=1 Tax=Streptomyces sp. NPDC006464 TaxID=3154305 RepID=UPI0033A0F21D
MLRRVGRVGRPRQRTVEVEPPLEFMWAVACVQQAAVFAGPPRSSDRVVLLSRPTP